MATSTQQQPESVQADHWLAFDDFVRFASGRTNNHSVTGASNGLFDQQTMGNHMIEQNNDCTRELPRGDRNVECFKFILAAALFLLAPVAVSLLDKPIPGWLLWNAPFMAAVAMLMAGHQRSETVPQGRYLALACYAIAAGLMVACMYCIMFI
ncbi:hypothetical protein QNL75_27035 [Pseudomonas amygdali pv. morsprunorum]|uniref:hypothetical protein n=1 Tax=Pseudomonas amygdali TaxID=47877 RepID=UPI002892486E|nr:hypothetical protein [Pseudomonas amygdali]MDT3268714.1 hypothetical protein [Pseudomonas amygdali pv. morsprunorum]